MATTFTTHSFKVRTALDACAFSDLVHAYSIGTILDFELVIHTDSPNLPLYDTPHQIRLGLFIPTGYNIELPGYYYDSANILVIGQSTPLNTPLIYGDPANPYFKHRKMVVEHRIAGNWEFTIWGSIFMVEDYSGYYGGGNFYLNRRRFLSASIHNPSGNLFNLPGGTVYNTVSNLRVYNYIDLTDPTLFNPPPDVVKHTSDYSINGRFFDKEIGTTTASSVSNCTFLFERNSAPVFTLSAFDDTKLTVTFETARSGVELFLWIVNESMFQNGAQNFLQDYRYDGRHIQTGATLPLLGSLTCSVYSSITGDMGNNLDTLIGPATAPTLIAPNTYEATCWINASTLLENCNHRVIAVVHTDNGTGRKETHSFVSPPMYTGEAPAMCPPVVTSSLRDTQQTMSDHIKAAPCERIESRVKFDATAYDACRTGYGMTLLGNIKQIVLTLHDQGYLNGFMHVYDQLVFSKIGGVWQNNYNNAAYPRYVTITETSSPNAIEIRNIFRLRTDANKPNIASYVNYVLQPNPLDNQDWQGKNIYVETKLIIEGMAGNTPFRDILIYRQLIEVKYFDTVCLTGVFKDLSNNPISQVTIGMGNFKLEVNSCGSHVGAIHVFAEQPFDSSSYVNEFSTNSLNLPVLQLGPLVGAVTYNPSTCIIDSSNLNQNKSYKIISIAKP